MRQLSKYLGVDHYGVEVATGFPAAHGAHALRVATLPRYPSHRILCCAAGTAFECELHLLIPRVSGP
jgi:hypothetical protein